MDHDADPLDRLIDDLARKAAEDYLREIGQLPPARPTDEERLAGETTLYRYFDAENRLLYVGVANDFEARDRAHRSASPWYQQKAQATTTQFPTRAEALAAERQAVRNESPLHNEQGATRDSDGGTA
ncbi:MAG: hypothetical protein RLN67_02400 [Algiphilus sp.]|uniref:hypothetical protein n=1 Tax=Algiphilus sp. TaxID=1872431 RepID=UPI0032ED2D2F